MGSAGESVTNPDSAPLSSAARLEHRPATKEGGVRRVFRFLLAFAMIGAGLAHFLNPAPFVRIVPAELPAHAALVAVSGAFEIALGASLLVPRLRQLAGFGLVALYLAVFPANIAMAVRHIEMDPAHPMPHWFAWVRLPFQIVFIALAIWVSRADALPSRDRAILRR